MKQEFNNDFKNRKLSEDEKEKYLNCYNPEFSKGSGLFNDLPTKENIEAKDILLIYRWKLGMKKKDDAKTIKKEIKSFEEPINDIRKKNGNEIKALTDLDKIKGVGLAVASTILSIYCPDKFSIIDRRVLQVLGCSGKKSKSGGWKPKSYWDDYMKEIKEISAFQELDLRTTDKILWGKSVSDEIDELLK